MRHLVAAALLMMMGHTVFAASEIIAEPDTTHVTVTVEQHTVAPTIPEIGYTVTTESAPDHVTPENSALRVRAIAAAEVAATGASRKTPLM